MAMIAVKTQTENRTRVAVLPQASAAIIPKWKLWGIRLFFSLADPGATLSAGLLVSLLLARWLPAEQYGAFALAFALFLFLSGIHNALVLEPMSVLGPASHHLTTDSDEGTASAVPKRARNIGVLTAEAEREGHRGIHAKDSDDQGSLADYFEAQIWVHLASTAVLVAPLLFAAALLALFGFGGSLPGALLGAGLALPFILLFWLARRMCCLLERSVTAMSAGAGSLVLLLCGLLAFQATHKTTPFTVFLLLGFTGLCAALQVFYKLKIGLDETRPCSVSWLSAAAANWRFGRWQLGGALCFASLGLSPLLLAPVFLGLASTGKLFAMQLPALLVLQCGAVAAMFLLPGFARESFTGGSERLCQLAHRVSLSLAGAALLFAALLYFFAAPVEHLLFGGKFANDARLMPLFMATPLFAGLASGYSMALRAMQRPQFDRLATRIAAAASVQTAFFFIPLWGLAGAAISLASGFAVHAAVVYLCFRQAAANDRKTMPTPQAQEVASFDHVKA